MKHLPFFKGSNVQITSEGNRHLGAAIGSTSFIRSYVTEKVKNWVDEVHLLSEIASSQPHAAYCALTHSLLSKWTYLQRTIPGISHLFLPLENAIRHQLLPNITGKDAFSDKERELFALPTRLGGLGITNLTTSADDCYNNSKKITAPLIQLILQQTKDYPSYITEDQTSIKSEMKAKRRHQQQEKAKALRSQLPSPMQRSMDLNQERGASHWLNVLPLSAHGFTLHKGAFRDALSLRYGWRPKHLPTQCVCGKYFSVDHAFSCSYGGYPSLRHNHIRDTTATLMKETCHSVSIEPHLQPITGETFQLKSANIEDSSRLDIQTQGFWGDRQQSAFFDIRVFNPFAQSNAKSSLEATYRKHENEETPLRAADLRSRAWIIHTTGDSCNWWNGQTGNHHVQAIGISIGRKKRNYILTDHELDSMLIIFQSP